jgi:PAS domain S-box-containing protein
MSKNLRNSGIDIIGEVLWGTHFCQFYQTREDLMDILVPYFKAGLESNEFCMWVTSQPLDVEEAKEALRRAVPDIDVYLEKGQIEIIPYTKWYVKEGVFDSDRVLNGWVEKLNQALANGYDGLRLTGNTFWLEKEDWNNFVDYEEEVDRVLGNYRMIALCTYCLDRCNATEIIDVVTNHQFALIKRAGEWEQIESSKRKEAEETAVRATKEWEYTFDAVPDLIAVIDTEYRIVRVNRAMAARLGVTTEECVGLTCYRVIHGTDEPPSFCPHRQLLEDGFEHTREVHENSLGGHFLVSVSPLYDTEGKLTGCVHVARDINERKQTEETLRQSEQRVRLKLKSLLSPALEMDNLELADIVDAQEIQSLMDDFYKLARIPMSLSDLEGNSLVGVGWQDICTKFHRVNPETCKHCIESDTKLSKGAPAGEFKLYRCKNNMWDIATPIMVGDQHVGNIFSGQFFFEDEPLDYELFRSQAKQYGFKEDEYVAALEKVPRLSRETVDTGVTFLMKLANMISQLSYSNIKLARTLAERDVLVGALHESEERLRLLGDNLPDSAIYQYAHEPNSSVRFLYCSAGIERLNAVSVSEVLRDPGTLHRQIPPQYFEQLVEAETRSARELSDFDMETPMRLPDGQVRWMRLHSRPRQLPDGRTVWDGVQTDITERKRAEEALQKQAALIDLSPDGIITRQLDGTINFWSRGAQSLYGWTSQEAIGQQTHDLLKTRFPQPLEQIDEQLKQTGQWSGELIHCTKDGRQIVVQSRWQAKLDDQGNVKEILESNVDITENKQAEESLRFSEQKFAMAFANNPAAIALTRLEDGLFLDVNDTWLALNSYSRDEVIGHFARTMHIWPTPEAAALFVQELREKGCVRGWEQEFYKKSGKVFRAQLSAQVLTVQEEKVIL